VLNRLNTVAVLRLSSDGRSARIVGRLTDPRFDVPTTVASYGNRLYLPNARCNRAAQVRARYGNRWNHADS